MPLTTEAPLEIQVPNGAAVRGYFQDSGKSAIGIFLPGFASDLNGSKSQLFARFAQQRQRSWMRFDYRGMGISDGKFSELSISRYLEDVGAVIQALPPQPILLIGSSMGGWVATRAAQIWPECVRALLLIAPAYNFVQDYYAQLSVAERQDWQARGVRQWSTIPGTPSFLLDFAAVLDADAHDVLLTPPNLDIPVLILHGSADTSVPVQRSLDFITRARARPLALRILPGVDHRLQGANHELLAAFEQLWAACSL